jgi:hypothetical protein
MGAAVNGDAALHGLTAEAALTAVAGVAGRASGAVGLAARQLESGESLT